MVFLLFFPTFLVILIIRKALQALKGAVHMWPQQIILLQETFKVLKEANEYDMHVDMKEKIETAMEHVQKTLQIQGVFVS